MLATFGGKQRNPVVLDRNLWEDVEASASGDVGARVFLRSHPELVRAVACDDVGSAFDVDTVSDLRRRRRSQDEADAASLGKVL